LKLLALDISSHTGWAVFEDGKLVRHGLIELDAPVLSFGNYPYTYVRAAQTQVRAILKLFHAEKPDQVCTEETNLGKNRYSQKFLEFLHCKFVESLDDVGMPVLSYISSSAWRSTLGLSMSKEDKKNNSKLRKAAKSAVSAGKKLDKKALGIKGKVNKKHLAVRYANATFGLNLKMKDNDIADAICLGQAFLNGATICDGQ